MICQKKLTDQWNKSGLLDHGSMESFLFGDQDYFEVSSGASQRLAPMTECKSPDSKSEALAFAMALKATREFVNDAPLQDAIYVEKLNRLLPTYGITSRTDDDIVLGYWLTGGASISAKSFRRLGNMMSWMSSKNLHDVVAASGITVEALARTEPDETVRESDKSQTIQHSDKVQGSESDLAAGLPYSLPGRPDLEDFFNEHVVDIIQNKERYKSLGIGFPSAIVLHGPPGCGKTFAVEKLIEHLGWPSYQIDASSVASPYIHETSRKVAEVFEKAMENAPSVLVIDEMEAFLADRESGSGSSHHRVEEVAEFLRRIPEATKNEVLIVAMTNRIDMIDQAILRRGRFDHIINVNFASAEEVLELLNTLLAKLPTESSVDAAPLARKLARRPLSDVAFVVREGARLSARTGKDKLAQEFLIAALEAAAPRTDEGSGNRIGFV